MNDPLKERFGVLKAGLEQLAFDIARGDDEQQLHRSVLALLEALNSAREMLDQTPELPEALEIPKVELPEYKPEEDSTERHVDEVDKVARKLPKWANNPGQINSRILNLALFLEEQSGGILTEAMLRSSFEDLSTFDRNFPPMKIIASKNHGKVFEVTAGNVEIWEPVKRYIDDYKAASIKAQFEQNFLQASDAFQSALGVEPRPFGQKNMPYRKGVSDDNQGVRWSIVVDAELGSTVLRINLEGMKYGDWPIARWLERELSAPQEGLLSLADQFVEGPEIQVAISRDAWQGPSRLKIKEKWIGGAEVSLSSLSEDQWNSMVNEAYSCLDEEQNHRGRTNQIVTLKSDGRELVREVTPHLQISAGLWTMPPLSAATAEEIIREKIELMKPIYDFLVDATAQS